uniref:Uncharacterized protein n=1 Tax=Branchiostoma floridae TaxID=7739 RepID=C3YTH2_BRAFL|eukprot:XP_002600527.1 hypothetical protein BRAFLDRAFT_70100 [Branchiostoma floridae]
MQTARVALGVALQVCPRTAVSTYTRPAADFSRGDLTDVHKSLLSWITNEETTSTEEANKCPRDVSDETPTAVGPVKMRDKALSTAKDARTASTESKKTSGDAVNEGRCSTMFDQRSPFTCPLGGGQVSEGNAGKDNDFCGDNVTSDVTTDVMDTCHLPDPAGGENAGNDVISSWGETSPRRADFTEAEVITVTACPVRHELSAATREVIGSTPHVTDKTDTEISSEESLSEGDL